MRWSAIAAVGLLLAVGTGGCAPRRPTTAELVSFALVVLTQQDGVEVPPTVVRQVEALVGGLDVEPVQRTPENQILSPITGKPCAFITTDGLTPAGVALAKLLLGTG